MGVMRFGLLGFPIHIQPGFWVIALLLVGSRERSFAEHLVLIGIILASILAHELGHALVARRSGLEPVVVIHAFGGITSWLPVGPLARGRAIAIAAAGPVAGLSLAVLAFVALQTMAPEAQAGQASPWRQALSLLVQVNVFWSVINLLPIMPFDGGQILTHLLGPTRRLTAARVSLIAGCVTALLLFRFRLYVGAAVFGVAAVMQFIAATRNSRQSASVGGAHLEVLLSQAQRKLEAGEHEAAQKLASSVIEWSPQMAQRRKAAELFAWAALGRGEPLQVRTVAELLASGPVDPLLQAAILEADGDAERAIDCLRQARVVGDLRPQVAASLVRLLLLVDRYGEAALTTIQILDHITEDEARRVMTACRDGLRPLPAADLAIALYNRTFDLEDLGWALVGFSSANSTEGVDKAMAIVENRRSDVSALLRSSAFARLPSDHELRQRVLALQDSVE